MRKSQPLIEETIQKKYVYPFFFALYPVLFLYLRNIREVLPVRVLPALSISLAIAIIFWLITRIASRQHGKRSLLLFLFLLLFHFYGIYYGLIVGLLPDDSRPLLSHAIAFILPGGLWFFLSWAVVHSTRSFTTFNRVLQLVVIFLLLWNGMGILIYHGRSFLSQNRLQSRGSPKSPKSMHDQTNQPDIYCFVLDEFASLESAHSLFQYDNSIFAETLRQQGFFIARNSHSRFQMTAPAIADILNLGDFDEKKDPYPLIRGNAVSSFLKQRGYRIIEIPLEPAMFMDLSDQRFYYSLTNISIFFDEFYRILFEHSLLRFLPDHWRRHNPDSSRYFRERVMMVFNKMKIIAQSLGPKFVYVHLLCPHEPFVFNAHGGTISKNHFWDYADPSFYLQQYIFVSHKITETILQILKDSPAPPVIIIQSDHGYRGSRGRLKQRRQVAWAEGFKVFNALLLPGISQTQISPSQSPLNNFRLVFNCYFGEHYPLLKDP
jgi:hypothetical protein